ncbi:hypothetical protein NUV25_29605, partial [Burkholderia pseudomultivorans]|uniref:hypothetical protein n=1 Tax=Burkholderia pseudomultivorans TaxID=1207504 RepID=UPI0028764700
LILRMKALQHNRAFTMQHHLCLPVLARRFGLYKVYDGQPGLFTTDDQGNLVKVDPFRVTPSLA